VPVLTTQLPVKEIIVGGWRPISVNSGLATQRDAVILSNGQGKDEDVLVDLSQFATVGMHSVGSLAGRSQASRRITDDEAGGCSVGLVSVAIGKLSLHRVPHVCPCGATKAPLPLQHARQSRDARA
jgi:hypothetical protein